MIAATAFRDECYCGLRWNVTIRRKRPGQTRRLTTAAQNTEIVERIMTKRKCGFNWEMALGVWSGDSWVSQR